MSDELSGGADGRACPADDRASRSDAEPSPGDGRSGPADVGRPWVPDLSAYRRRRRVARWATTAVVIPLLWFATEMVVILRAGGDTRFGIVPYLQFVVVVVVGWLFVVPLWRRAHAARQEALPPLDVEEPPGPHLGLTGLVPPPGRW